MTALVTGAASGIGFVFFCSLYHLLNHCSAYVSRNLIYVCGMF
jgi:short-subunit dehydrogenase